MKAVQKISYLLIVFIICIFTACDQEGNEKNGGDIRIVKELPKMYFSPVDTEIAAIINSMAEFDKLIKDKENLQNYPELETIDWTKQTLLLGYCSYKNQANIIHHFYQVDNLEYLYHISLSGYTSGPDNFLFGIIVDKLPENSTVTFEIEKEEGVEMNSPFNLMELPKMNIKGLEVGASKVINNQEEFNAVFSSDDIKNYSELSNINWNLYTLLVNRHVNPTLIVSYSHSFKEKASLNYQYLLEIISGSATAIDDFSYGILVHKLPGNAIVEFVVKEVRP